MFFLPEQICDVDKLYVIPRPLWRKTRFTRGSEGGQKSPGVLHPIYLFYAVYLTRANALVYNHNGNL